MDNLRTASSFALLLFLIVSSISIVNPSSAATIPKPSVPEFTAYLAGPTFTKNTTYSLDSNSGQIVPTIGYTNQYSSIVLVIKNQPFDSTHGTLYYSARIKCHNAEGWRYFWYDGPNPNVQSSSYAYTNFTVNIEGFELAGTQTDIQVQALLGGYSYGRDMSSPLAPAGYSFVGETSDWSSTQTLSIPANIPLTPTSPSSPPNPMLVPTSNPSLTPQSPTSTAGQSGTNPAVPPLNWLELAAFAVLGVVVALLVVFIILLRRRIKVLELKHNGA